MYNLKSVALNRFGFFSLKEVVVVSLGKGHLIKKGLFVDCRLKLNFEVLP